MSADLTPEQIAQIAKIAANFQARMRRTCLGVSIRVGDGPWIEVTPLPDGQDTEDAGEEQ